MVNPALDATAATGAAFEGLAGDVDSQMDGLLRSIASKDWKGALGGVLDVLGGQGGKLGGWAKIGGDILKHLPGFKTGGSFRVGGSGGVDSSLVAFRATPGEMVDVRRPGQDLARESALRVMVETNDDRFNAYVDNRVAPQASAAFTGARQTVPSDMARTSKYTLSGRR